MGKVDKLIEGLEENSKLPTVRELFEDYKKLTKIERLKEEDLVISELFKGTQQKDIIAILKDRHPGESFYPKDVVEFIDRNNKFLEEFKSHKGKLMLRHARAKVNIEEKLGHIILFTEHLIKKYDEKKDSSSTVAALNVLNKTIMNYAQISGLLKDTKEEKLDNIIKIVSRDKNEKIERRILEADFKLVDAEVVEDNEVQDS